MLQVDQLRKSYATPAGEIHALDGVSFSLPDGCSAAIVGPSGSGKTTLLGLCAGLDLPTAGSVHLLGHSLSDLDENRRARLRNDHIGFVFQNFQLVPTLTALENVAIPLELKRAAHPARAAREWLDRVGLADRAEHYPVQLSGGEQQRVAIARACVAEPAVLFADEPTGNLDGSTRNQIKDLLFEVHQQSGNSLILVTHDLELAAETDHRIHLRSGRVSHSEESSRGSTAQP
jgi:putative ABC transport system ATP-binding protein